MPGLSRIKYVIKRNGAMVPFTQERITNAIFRAAVSVGGRDRSISEALGLQVTALLEEQFRGDNYPGVEHIQDIVEKVLIENGHARLAKAYILYRDERNRRRNKDTDRYQQRSEYIPWAKMWSVLDWALDHEVNTVDKLNHLTSSGGMPNLVAVSEAAYAQELGQVTEAILERRQQVKLVIVAGPSSSGKTTTTNKINLGLGRQGLRFVELNLDNYYFDLDQHPKDEFGDYDFETPQSLDIALINRHLHALLSGQEVLLPYYDFKQGKRFNDRTAMTMGEGEIILIDSLYGLYPPLTDGLEDEKVRLYLEPLLQMKMQNGKYVRWTDIRLMRRMLRDAATRAYGFEQTLTHWHYVRSSEMRYIIPYMETADFIINTSMPYELPLYAFKLGSHFAEWSERYRDDPLRLDAFTRAERIHAMLSTILPWQEDSTVPADSVIREFIGGLKLD